MNLSCIELSCIKLYRAAKTLHSPWKVVHHKKIANPGASEGFMDEYPLCEQLFLHMLGG